MFRNYIGNLRNYISAMNCRIKIAQVVQSTNVTFAQFENHCHSLKSFTFFCVQRNYQDTSKCQLLRLRSGCDVVCVEAHLQMQKWTTVVSVAGRSQSSTNRCAQAEDSPTQVHQASQKNGTFVLVSYNISIDTYVYLHYNYIQYIKIIKTYQCMQQLY